MESILVTIQVRSITDCSRGNRTEYAVHQAGILVLFIRSFGAFREGALLHYLPARFLVALQPPNTYLSAQAQTAFFA